jgi:hypothetical protein
MGAIHDWGSTAEERARAYPCDRYIEAPNLVCFRAVDVRAPAAVVYRWLCQMRVAPYSYDWLDNFGRQSPRVRDPANERLELGQPMMRIFRLAEFVRDEHLTLIIERTRMFGALAITYQVAPAPSDDGARLVAKLVTRLGRASPMRAILPLGDLIMMRKQLLTLKTLAEAEHQAAR